MPVLKLLPLSAPAALGLASAAFFSPVQGSQLPRRPPDAFSPPSPGRLPAFPFFLRRRRPSSLSLVSDPSSCSHMPVASKFSQRPPAVGGWLEEMVTQTPGKNPAAAYISTLACGQPKSELREKCREHPLHSSHLALLLPVVLSTKSLNSAWIKRDAS